MTNERPKCPCCGEGMYALRIEKEAIHQMIDILLQDPDSLTDWIVEMFTLMHFPDRGKPVEL